MINLTTKGKSPFYPGQPVPPDMFVGRYSQVEHIIQRGVGQVAAGKPVAMFVEGEYGIGKSSIAGVAQTLAERHFNLHGIYAPLGNMSTMDALGAVILEGTVRSGAFDPSRSERIRNWLAKYIGEQTLLGITIHGDVLKKDAPTVTSGLLPFLHEVMRRLEDTGVKGIYLVLDEINGIASDPQFAHFLKGLVDTNALSPKPLPLLLMLCGVRERRRELIRCHQPVERIFDIVEIEPLSSNEMEDFLRKAFDSVHLRVEPDALALITEYAAGFPKIMQLLGDAAFWIDDDGVISKSDAMHAVLVAAEEVGRKYVDEQVYSALRSVDYHSILTKIARMGPSSMSFKRAEVVSGLTESERKKFDNFLQKMKALQVIRSGEVQGEYVFNLRMTRLYIWLQSIQKGGAA